MNLIDTHAHLDVKQFKPDFDLVIKRAKEAGITAIINIGPSVNSSLAAAKISDGQIKMFSTIGLHPEYAPLSNPDKSIPLKMKALEKIYQANPEKVVAVGECGLDYYSREDSHVLAAASPRNDDSGKPNTNVIANEVKQSQKQLFQAQIDLARKLNLPIIIHCRDAWQDIFDFNFEGINGVFHSFTSNPETAKKVLDLGFYLSFSCIVTYPKNEHLREIIKETPLDKILTETDCPFLPPQTKRGQRCEPADVTEVIKIIAQMKEISFEQAANITFENANKLFRLS